MKKHLLLSFALLVCVSSQAQLVSTFAGKSGTPGVDLSSASRDSSMYNGPWGLAFDTNGHLWISESLGHRIKMITSDGLMAYGRSGNLALLNGDKGYNDAAASQAKWYSPAGIAIAPDNSIVIADRDNQCIRRLSPYVNVGNTQMSEFVAGGTDINEAGYVNGKAAFARFDQPYDVAVDANGIIYVSDTYNHCIRKVDLVRDEVTTFAGGGTKQGYKDGQDTTARFFVPMGLCWDNNGDLLVADRYNYRIRRVNVASSPAGLVTTVAGTSTDDILDGPLASACFELPTDVACDKNGAIYVCEGNQAPASTAVNVIRRIAGGKVITIAGQPNMAGTNDGIGSVARFNAPVSITLNKTGDMLFVADYFNHAIRNIHLWPVAISATEMAKTVEIYPNPVIGGSMYFRTGFETQWFCLNDLTGRQVISGQLSGMSGCVQLPCVTAGMYLLSITSQSGQHITKPLFVN